MRRSPAVLAAPITAAALSLVAAGAFPAHGSTIRPATSAVRVSSTASSAHPLTTVTAVPLRTWQTNGQVWATASVRNVVYVGGTFSKVRPPHAKPGKREVSRGNFAAFNAKNGHLLGCTANFELAGKTPAIEDIERSPNGKLIYVGGLFDSVDGTAVSNLVALNTSDCSLDTAFSPPSINERIWALKATPTTVYFGGKFTRVGSQTRTRLAAVDATTGSLDAWSPTADSDVRAIAISPNRQLVYVGGQFFHINGNAIHALVALDATSGAVKITYPDWEPYANARITGIAHDKTHLFIAAEGFGQPTFEGRLAGDLYDNTIVWRDDCKGANQDVLPYKGVLYSASHTHKCTTTPGGWLDQRMGGRQHLIAQSIAHGGRILPWFPDTNEGAGGVGLGPWHLTMASHVLWVGGEFTTVNGHPQQSLTRFGFSSTKSARPAKSPIPKATSTIAHRATIRWFATWDRDNGPLTYTVYRDGKPIHTMRYDSRYFRRPMLYYIDKHLKPGSRHTYQVSVSDGETTLKMTHSTNVRIARKNAGYQGQILADGASLYWRLGDKHGAKKAKSLTGSNAGRYEGAVTTGADGAIHGSSNTAASFAGTNGYVVDPTLWRNPQAYSVEIWFKTSSTKGGRIIGFGTSSGSSSSDTDRQVYMSNTGQLTFGAWHDVSRTTVETTGSYNDGNWHYLVATGGPRGMHLYVDGKQVAKSSNQWAHQYNGYWKIGNDIDPGWPHSGSDKAFNGTLDEAAVYPFQISKHVIAAHYRASGR